MAVELYLNLNIESVQESLEIRKSELEDPENELNEVYFDDFGDSAQDAIFALLAYLEEHYPGNMKNLVTFIDGDDTNWDVENIELSDIIEGFEVKKIKIGTNKYEYKLAHIYNNGSLGKKVKFSSTSDISKITENSYQNESALESAFGKTEEIWEVTQNDVLDQLLKDPWNLPKEEAQKLINQVRMFLNKSNIHRGAWSYDYEKDKKGKFKLDKNGKKIKKIDASTGKPVKIFLESRIGYTEDGKKYDINDDRRKKYWEGREYGTPDYLKFGQESEYPDEEYIFRIISKIWGSKQVRVHIRELIAANRQKISNAIFKEGERLLKLYNQTKTGATRGRFIDLTKAVSINLPSADEVERKTKLKIRDTLGMFKFDRENPNYQKNVNEIVEQRLRFKIEPGKKYSKEKQEQIDTARTFVKENSTLLKEEVAYLLSTTKQYMKAIREVKSRLYGCIVFAAYFQIVVSNTPIDEDYRYKRLYVDPPSVKKGKLRVRGVRANQGALESEYGDGKKEFTGLREGSVQLKPRIVSEKHEKDDYVVRGDWIIEFRGKRFKAFDTVNAPYNDTDDSDVRFSEGLFVKPNDIKAILQIANEMNEQTKDYVIPEDEDLTAPDFIYNINPRWAMLEYGGYTRTSKNFAQERGAQYGFEHGSKNGFSYQAPKGFLRIANALWNTMVESGEFDKIVEDYQNNAIKDIPKMNLNVKDVDSKLVQELIKSNPRIGSSIFSGTKITGE